MAAILTAAVLIFVLILEFIPTNLTGLSPFHYRYVFWKNTSLFKPEPSLLQLCLHEDIEITSSLKGKSFKEVEAHFGPLIAFDSFAELNGYQKAISKSTDHSVSTKNLWWIKGIPFYISFQRGRLQSIHYAT